MTVTTHAEIHACPRRWALSAAEYRDIWAGRGYPPRIQVQALSGSVIHLALETITRQLVRAGCGSVEDAKTILVMKELGGYTKLVHECISRVIERFTENPRALPLMEDTSRALRSNAAGLRTRIQSILARVRIPPAADATKAIHGGDPRRRGPLTSGAFPEVELRARRIGWKGKADLLVLSEEGCEITDFKTGAPDEAHKFQVQVYALLWALDDELNPTGRLADRLVVAYEGGDVEVAPLQADQLTEFENGLVERRAAAEAAVSVHPPEARPSADNCRYCGVRQICDEYWASDIHRAVDSGWETGFCDVELEVVRRHGPSSWDATILLSRVAGVGAQALLRTTGPSEFRAGERLRLLNAALAHDPEAGHEPVILTLGRFSEVYSVG
jgi:hypothetical protein